MDTHSLGGDLQGNKQPLDPTMLWPDMWKHMSDASKKKAKQRWAFEKTKLDNARLLRGIFFIEPTMKNSSSQ